MNGINILFIAVQSALLTAMLIWGEVLGVVFVFAYLGLMLLLALSSRALTFVHDDKKAIAVYMWIVGDFVCKSVGLVLVFLAFALSSVVLIMVGFALSAVLAVTCMVTWGKAVIGDTIPQLGTTAEDVKLGSTGVTNFAFYIGSVVFLTFPDYTKSFSVVFAVLFVAACVAFLCGAYKFTDNYIASEKRKKSKIVFTVCFFASMGIFAFVRYVMLIESPMNIFTIIAATVMLPYFNAVARVIQGEARKNRKKIEKG
jgi:hypothetical protein